MLKPKRDGRTKLFDRFDFDDFIDRSISFEIASEAPLKEGTRILEGVGFQLKVGRDQTLCHPSSLWPTQSEKIGNFG